LELNKLFQSKIKFGILNTFNDINQSCRANENTYFTKFLHAMYK